MWIQSTVEITREDAINKALKIYAENNRFYFEALSNSYIENYIEEDFYNYKII